MASLPKQPAVLFLLDWKPLFWSTREEYYRQICQRISAQGIVPILTVSELSCDRVRERFEAAGAKVHICNYGLSLPVYFRYLRKVVRSYEIRLAHIRFFDFFNAVHWLCQLAGIRTIFFTEANSGIWKAKGLRGRIARLRAWFVCASLTHVWAISEFIRRRLEDLGIPRERITVVYNGVDTAAFQPDPQAREQARSEMDASPDTIVLAFVAVLRDWKRPEIAQRVCAELRRRGRPAQLWIVGEGALVEDLKREASQLGVAEDVRYIGFQPDPQRWIAGADMLIHTAVGEAFGNVLVEALASGLPVVATRSGAADEIIVEGESGYLVPPGPDEVKKLADAAERCFANSSMSLQAVERAKRFTVERCVEQSIEIYKPFLAG